jgi:FkbM family methyltransferase
MFNYEENAHFNFFNNNQHVAELFIQSILTFFVREGDTVIDVGANHGLYTQYLANLVGETGCVYAFEAVPSLADNLQRNFPGKPVKIINKAVTSQENAGKISFHYAKLNDGFSGIKRRPDVKDEWDVECITVPATTLDHILSESTKISFIKIDVEGGDFDVLKGAVRILNESKPLVVFEYTGGMASELYNYTHDEFFCFFKKLNYNLYMFTGGKYCAYDAKAIRQKMYWELWAVPKDAPYEFFFQRNIEIFADVYISNFTHQK